MIEVVIDSVGDTFINAAANRQSTNYGSGSWVQVDAGELIGLLKPHLGNIAGRTVLDAYLVGHSAKANAAQTLTVTPATERWVQGRVDYDHAPAVNAAAAVSDAIAATAVDEAFTIEGLGPMMQAVADGTAWEGLQLTTSATTPQAFWSSDSGKPAWELHLVLSEVPDQPTGQTPDGGRAVSTATPTTGWEFTDHGDDDANEQAFSQVQVDTPAVGVEPDEVAPDYDSGWQANVDPQWSLVARHTLVGAGPHYWRVRVADADGTDPGSAWSDWAEFTVDTGLGIVVDSPTGPFGDPTPEITAHITGGGTLTRWSAKVTGSDRSDVRARTGMVTQAGGTIAWTVPFREQRLDAGIVGTTEAAFWTPARRVLRDDRPGWLYIRAWDDADRAVAIGEKGYADVWVELEFDDDLGVTAPTNLTVTQLADGDPRHAWEWEHTEVAEAYVLRIDGVNVARLEPADLTINAGVYTYEDDRGIIAPLRPHTLSVHAIENGQRSAPAEVLDYSYTADGFRVISADPDIDPIVLNETDVDDWLREDFIATYVTSTGEQVDITYGQPGLSNTFRGSIDNRDGDDDLWATVASIKALRKSRNRLAQVVWGSRSITARIRSIDATPAGDILDTTLLHRVAVAVVQLDED